MRRVFFFVLLTFVSVLISNGWAQKHTIKFATLAPEGSTWMVVMREYDKELREKTNGEVGFKIYAGGVLGDEKDVLRRIRIGQIQSAGFTGVGMGEILPEVRILDTPFLFRNYEEVDHIYNKFYERFAEGFESKNYVLLGWAEVGFVYMFAKKKAANLDEMRKLKMWVWEGDRVAEATFKAFGLQPIPLSVIDVMTALQTNMIEGVYTSPLGLVVLQWFTKVKFMINIPLANAAGAVLVSKEKYDKLPDIHKNTLRELGRKYMSKLTQLSRDDNAKAIETLKKNNITFVSVDNPQVLQSYYDVGKKARRSLVNKFYSESLLNQIENELNTLRSSNGSLK